MKIKSILFLLVVLFAVQISSVEGKIPTLSKDGDPKSSDAKSETTKLKFLPFIMLVSNESDTSEYWRETEILSLVKKFEDRIEQFRCSGDSGPEETIVQIPSFRTVRPICTNRIDFQLCPQCAHFTNSSECELFQDSCRERKVQPSEYNTYCDNKYGKWRTVFIPADYTKCRCCDECVMYRELDQSCMHDEYDFDAEEFLPVTTNDFRAGCNPYWGHPDQEAMALRCDKVLRRCVPVTVPPIPRESLHIRRSFRFLAPTDPDCPSSCRGYECPAGMRQEQHCPVGAYLPNRDLCNCCGECSTYYQLGQKCANFKKTLHKVNDSNEMEVEEEFLEPGCDDALVCRQGACQDIHSVRSNLLSRSKRHEGSEIPYEPCKNELKKFKKKYGELGHLHFEAPQCTPLWLFAPVQCRRFVCYCALEDGTLIEGIKVPRVEVSNMNCDCAREKCRNNSEVDCDGYGNYRSALFTPHVERTSNNYAASGAGVH